MIGRLAVHFGKPRSRYEPLTTVDGDGQELETLVSGSTDSGSLPHDDDDDDGEKISDRFATRSELSIRQKKVKGLKYDFTTISLVVCVATLILNAILLYIFKRTISSYPEPNVDIYALNHYIPPPDEKLRRPSQYKGLDKLNRTSLEGVRVEERMSIINFPVVVGRVDGSRNGMGRVITGGKESRRFDLGVGFEARAVEVSNDVSSRLSFYHTA